jgi:hypothetical protein
LRSTRPSCTRGPTPGSAFYAAVMHSGSNAGVRSAVQGIDALSRVACGRSRPLSADRRLRADRRRPRRRAGVTRRVRRLVLHAAGGPRQPFRANPELERRRLLCAESRPRRRTQHSGVPQRRARPRDAADRGSGEARVLDYLTVMDSRAIRLGSGACWQAAPARCLRPPVRARVALARAGSRAR